MKGMVFLLLLLSGCTTYEAIQTGAEVVKSKAADIADERVKGHIWALCQAMPIGAIRRKFGKDPGAYVQLCGTGTILGVGK